MPAKMRMLPIVTVLFLLVIVVASCASPEREDSGDVDLAATIASRVEQEQSEEAEPDYEATIEFSVAATQAAMAADAPAAEPPAPESGTDSESTAVPTPRPEVDPNPELLLPFWDDFDQGLDPIWRVVNGRPLFVEGRLTSASGELSLELGNTDLRNYTLEFDVSEQEDEECIEAEFSLGFSPTLKYRYYNPSFGTRKSNWYSFDSNEWDEILESSVPKNCGHHKFIVRDNTYKLYINGDIVEDLIIEPAEGPLLFKIEEGTFIDNFSIEP